MSRAEGRPITTISVRDAVAPDHEAVLALNNGATPHVNVLSGDAFAWIVARAAYFRVAEDPTGFAGFVIALPPGLEYWSLNYRWFSDRGGAFLYLDRVVVAERSRRSGIGRALYGDLGRFAAGRWPRITLEVNLVPPNPVSVAFHERLGFTKVGVRQEDGGAKSVVLMEWLTASASAADRGGRAS